VVVSDLVPNKQNRRNLCPSLVLFCQRQNYLLTEATCRAFTRGSFRTIIYELGCSVDLPRVNFGAETCVENCKARRTDQQRAIVQECALMNPLEFALRRPITILVMMTGLIGAGWLAYSRMKVDIFPSLNLPVIYVCQPYGGMDPLQMEGLLTNYYEYHFLYINGIHHVESKNVQGVAIM